MRVLRVEGASKNVAVAEKRIEALLASLDNHRITLPRPGVPLLDLDCAAFGVNAVGLQIHNHDDTIQNNPELVRRFVKAAMRAFETAMANPAASIRAGQKATSDLEARSQPGTAEGRHCAHAVESIARQAGRLHGAGRFQPPRRGQSHPQFHRHTGHRRGDARPAARRPRGADRPHGIDPGQEGHGARIRLFRREGRRHGAREVDGEGLDEFYDWHHREHMPERLGIPGFRRGRRYVRSDGEGQTFFNLYEVDCFEALVGQDYLNRLIAPPPWTKRAVQHFRAVTRGLCGVAGSSGIGQGGTIATLRIAADAGRDEVSTSE